MVGVAAGFLVVGALASAGAARDAGIMNQQIAERNAALKDQAAIDASHLGLERANLVRLNAERIKGEQIAAFAGQGVDVAFGSSVDIANEVDMQSELEVDTIINNTKLAVWGIQTEAVSERFGGAVARAAGASAAQGTVLTGLGSAAAVGVSGSGGSSGAAAVSVAGSSGSIINTRRGGPRGSGRR